VNVVGQVVSSHQYRPVCGHETGVRAQQIAQDEVGVGRVEVLGGFVEQHNSRG
jgi:hypothetical protein